MTTARRARSPLRFRGLPWRLPVLVGTGDQVERLIRETNPSADVMVASNPEFLRAPKLKTKVR